MFSRSAELGISCNHDQNAFGILCFDGLPDRRSVEGRLGLHSGGDSQQKFPRHELSTAVSVIIPVYNDAVRIETALRAVLAQTYPAEAFEILVVENNSTDGTPEAVRRLQDEYPGRIQLLAEDQIQSSYAARNTGIRHARGEIIAFTDSDCRPAPDWLANGVRALTKENAAFVAGHVQMVFRKNRPNVVEYFDACLYLDQKDNAEIGDFGATANLFAWRELFDRHGLFCQDLQSGGDLEFGRRLTRAGEMVAYASDVIVYHPARFTFGAYLKKEKRVSLGHRRLRELGVMDGLGITWRSFVPWARFRQVEGISLTLWEKAGVRALLIGAKYFRLAYKLMPSAMIAREHPVRRLDP